MTEAQAFAQEYLDDARHLFREYKKLAENALAQMSDEDFFYAPDSESNSIAVIMKHMSGNMRSRWRDFLTSDGEKPDRNRDQEFEVLAGEDRRGIMQMWEEGWKFLFDALSPLQPSDLNRTIYIRHQPHSVVQAINRQLTHYSYHVGQIVFLAKHIRAGEWKSLSVPRGNSEKSMRR